MSSFSTFSGVLPFASPSLLDTLKTWVSTPILGWSNAVLSITFALFLPTPGNFIISSKVSGIEPLYFSIKIFDVAIIFFAFVLQRPIVFMYFCEYLLIFWSNKKKYLNNADREY